MTGLRLPCPTVPSVPSPAALTLQEDLGLSQLSVSVQGLDEQVVQAADHGSGVVDEPRCDHGILVDLKGKAAPRC